MVSRAFSGAFPAVHSAMELLQRAVHPKGLIHTRKIFSSLFLKQQMGSTSPLVPGVGTSGQMLISALTGDLASHASGEAVAGPNRRCSEGTDCITP